MSDPVDFIDEAVSILDEAYHHPMYGTQTLGLIVELIMEKRGYTFMYRHMAVMFWIVNGFDLHEALYEATLHDIIIRMEDLLDETVEVNT